MLALWPPTEVAEGYQYETVRESSVLSDGVRNMHISYVPLLAHAEGMLMGYLPKEKMVIEADLYDSPAPNEPLPGSPTAANRSFYNHVRRLALDVTTIVPINGRATPWSDFVKIIGNEGGPR